MNPEQEERIRRSIADAVIAQAEAIARIVELQEENAELRATIATLEARLRS